MSTLPGNETVPSSHVQVKRSVTQPLGMRDAAAPAVAIPGDCGIVDIDLGEGLSLFTAREALHAQVVDESGQRDGGAVLRLRSEASRTRGGGDLMVHALRFLEVDVDAWLGPFKNKAAEVIAAEVARRIDHREVAGRSGLGLWRTSADTPYAQLGMDGAGEQPALVMLHGFFSNARGSFGGLWEPQGRATLEALRSQYNERIYAYDHATLGESAVSNALALAQALPEGQPLHLLSFSRGGLIGELLSRAQAEVAFSDLELEAYARVHGEGGEQLRELRRVLREKRIQVQRFVRVAGPVRGTWLASDRLDRWLSIFWNVARLALPEGGRQIADFVFDLIATVIEKRLDRRLLPGVESMSPSGPLVALLNRNQPLLDQRLAVIAGDCVGQGLLHRLKVLVSDGFFGERHDLVVPTASMFGGAPRAGGMGYFFHQTPRVDHFHYFDNPETLQRVRWGLTDNASDYGRLLRLASPQDPAQTPQITANRAPPRNDAPLDVVLPGIMGSALEQRGYGKLWVDLRDFALGRFGRLRLDGAQREQPDPLPDSGLVYPGAPLDAWPVNTYGALLKEIERRGEMPIASGYDWRKPIRVSADALAARLRLHWPEGSPRPLRLIAHSMGGLVARLMFQRHPDLRKRFEASPHNRLLMLGTPNRGSLAVVKALMGDNKLLGMIDCLSLPDNRRELLSVAATFPGFLELLPEPGGDSGDWGEPAAWQRLYDLRGIAPALRPQLDAQTLALAAQGRRELAAAMSALPLKNSLYVAGFVAENARDATIVGLDANGRYRLGPGDGTVPYASGLIEGVPTYYVNAKHGDLPAQRDAFAGYFELLDRGETARLPTHCRDFADTRRGVPLDSSEPEDGLSATQLPYRPSQEQIYRALLGMSPTPEQPLQSNGAQPIRVSAVHGGLCFALHPIIVGHYAGDTMRGSEAELDRLYGGQLRRSADLGVYPGAEDTSQVFKREQDAPDLRSPYAIVVGLGRQGELTVGGLRRAVRRGVLSWYGAAAGNAVGGADAAPEPAKAPAKKSASESASESAKRPAKEPASGFSLVLLGSSVSGMSVGECLRAILQGVTDAQDVLLERRAVGAAQALRTIEEIELIEIFQDKALALAAELQAIVASNEFKDRFELGKGGAELLSRSGARTRLRDASDAGESVRRLDIRSLGGGHMSYALPGIQAAVPIYARNFDNAEIRAYACQTDSGQNTDPSLGRVLFHQLLPLDLKRFALEQYDLLLGLDQAAASIPWELADAGAPTPLSVQSGMIRQLQSTRYVSRERVVQNLALVVGQPRVDALPPLPGARREAAAVADALRSAGFEVIHLDCPTALQVRDELGRRPYRVVHFAGHGVVDYLSPLSERGGTPMAGMVIGSLPAPASPAAPATPAPQGARGDSAERGRNERRDACAQGEPAPAPPHLILLTPEDVRECVAQVPEVVFINCCHLGRQSGLALNAPLLASNLANSFMDIGCRAVVAAGWAVDDVGAECFATEFYRALVGQGQNYIKAVRRARAATYDRYKDRTSTWGAYQCYGDANYSMMRPEDPQSLRRFCSGEEYRCWLADQEVLAMSASAQALEVIRAMLLRQVPGTGEDADADAQDKPRRDRLREWLGDEGVCMAAVSALECLGENAAALRLVEARIRQRRSISPRMWSAQARLALRSGADAGVSERAMQSLRRFAEFEDSAAAWYNYGTYCRRWFLSLDDPAQRLNVLQQLVHAMFRGLDSVLVEASEGADGGEAGPFGRLDVDSAQKALGAMIVAESLGAELPDMSDVASFRRSKPAYSEMAGICERQLTERKSNSEFWQDTDSSDLMLLLLASPHGSKEPDYAVQARTIRTHYQRAMDISATPSQRDSIFTYMRFWYRFAAFCATRDGLSAARRKHWTALMAAMEEAQMTGDPD